MNTPKTILVSVYAKIYTDTFSNEMINRYTTGNDLYAFLMRDSGHCFDDEDNRIPGDLNLWYLGCNEKFGHLQYQDKVLSWSFGESSFDTVELFVSMIHRDGFFTEQQFQILMAKIEEGRQFDCMYSIKDYLTSKRNKQPWQRTKQSCQFRSNMKQFKTKALRTLQNEGYQIFI